VVLHLVVVDGADGLGVVQRGRSNAQLVHEG
jgi:hypothetical protein